MLNRLRMIVGTTILIPFMVLLALLILVLGIAELCADKVNAICNALNCWRYNQPSPPRYDPYDFPWGY